MHKAILYPNQKDEVKLHDEVKIRAFYLFPWYSGVVTYVPNVSDFRKDMVDGGMQCIGITTKSDMELAYVVDHENNNVVCGFVKLVKRKDMK